MSWSTDIKIGDDGAGGNITATFIDTDNSVYSRSAYIAPTAQARDKFIAEAIAGRNLWRTQKTTNANFKNNVDARFTTLDV